ncbi:ABC transporter permease [uncultured Sphaerochaeta sp.]|uniref:ABC transporter permease n=1 Tax=uncultured Sphaerochaeta sp. TaxID=886478 RepID=UPI0029CA8E87|nr:ABC transporter permease [uncultured Sphaerochaeta sp.]
MNRNVLQWRSLDKQVILTLFLFLLSLTLPFLQSRENRISEEFTVHVLSLGFIPILLLLAPPLMLLASVIIPEKNHARLLTSASMAFGVIFPILVLGIAGNALVENLGAFARYSPASGMYVYFASVSILYFMQKTLQRRDKIALFLVLIMIVGMGFLGMFDRLGILLEARNLGTRLAREILSHIRITGISLLISMLIGIPIAFLAFMNKAVRRVVFPILNVLQTIPGIALFGLLIAPLAALSRAFPVLRDWGIQGIGNAPAIIALSMYALYPIIRYTYTSLTGIDEQVVLAAKGMGMTSTQLWKIVRLPLATVGILHGIRVALVQTIGNATLAKLIGGDGLGVLVFEGLGQASVDMVLLGMLLIIAITVISDRLFQFLIKVFTPKSLAREDR